MRRFSAASAGRFGEPAFWREFYARKSKSGPFEWFVDADVAARALQPLLPRSLGGGRRRVLHLGCGTSALGPLLAEQGHVVVNVDYDRGCLEAASAQVGSRPEWARHRVAAGEGGELWRHRGGGTCEWLLHDMCALPAHWSGRFDAVVDKGGLCAAIFAGEAYAAAACREAARCSTADASMHYITDDAPELRIDLLRAALPGYEVVGASIAPADEEDEEDAFGHHRREYFVYSATRTPVSTSSDYPS